MKKIFKLALVLTGFTSAILLSSNDVKASKTSDKMEDGISRGAGCIGSGDCGTSRGGVRLEGKWREW